MSNNLPPRDISAAELLLKLIERPRPSAVVDYPAKSPTGQPLARIRIMVLGGDQQEEARFRAKEYLKSKRRMADQDFETELGRSLLGDAVARECIAMACHMVEAIEGSEDNPKYPVIFQSAADVNKLPADEITALFGAYCAVQKKFGPFDSGMTEQEINAWIQRLEEGASALPLSLIASSQRDELCLRLSARAACLSKLLISQRQNSPINWESIPETWALDTSWSSEPAVESSPSGDPSDVLITQEAAIEAAKAMAKLNS